MGKRQDTSTEEEIVIDTVNEPSPPKKHKKHKHKKHKKKKSMEASEELGMQELFFDDTSAAATLKLKIKLAKESPSPSTSIEKSQEKGSPVKMGEKVMSSANSSPKTSKKKKSKGKDSGTSSEEERWLDAIESGKLEEVDDELKKIKPKDPKLMTARQRAMFERKTDKEPSPGGEQLLALPSGYKEKVMTAEALQKAALKSQKRKQLADEKREKDKKKTMERLLRKQEAKSAKANKAKGTQKIIPRVTYIHNAEGISISLPAGVEFPLEPQHGKPPPAATKCGCDGCPFDKKYSCSKTGIPLCSLECYRRNLVNRGLATH